MESFRTLLKYYRITILFAMLCLTSTVSALVLISLREYTIILDFCFAFAVFSFAGTIFAAIQESSNKNYRERRAYEPQDARAYLHVIWETFVSLVSPPIFLVLWLVLGLLVLYCLNALDLPFMKEYFGILVMVVLIVPPVVLLLYAERKQKRADKNG